MKLIHYSKHPVSLPLIDTTARLERGGFKPDGLWVSVEGEDDWKSWCQSEGFGLDRFEYETEIVLAADHRVWVTPFPDEVEEMYRIGGSCYRRDYIDWPRVAEQYDGLIITPYCWESRLGVSFYYSWDCASGCIWNPRAIERVTIRKACQAVIS